MNDSISIAVSYILLVNGHLWKEDIETLKRNIFGQLRYVT
jgi:hypothetical protein